MPFPPAFLDELAARNPIEEVVGQYVNLKRSGSNLFGLCPFHGEKTPSFSVRFSVLEEKTGKSHPNRIHVFSPFRHALTMPAGKPSWEKSLFFVTKALRPLLALVLLCIFR